MDAATRQIYRRRRIAALSVLAGLVLGIVMVAGGSAPSQEPNAEAAKPAGPPELPLGGRTIFPRYRVVAYYGAPQSDELGALGIGSPTAAGRRLRRQARPYARKTRPVMLAFELIVTVANGAPGTDAMYRT